jgi:hypothetical protein
MLTADTKLGRDLSVTFLPLEPNGAPRYLYKWEIGANKLIANEENLCLWQYGPHFPASNIQIGDGKQKTTRRAKLFCSCRRSLQESVKAAVRVMRSFYARR